MSRRIEFLILGAVVFFSIVIQFFFRLDEPMGPDAGTYLANAELILYHPDLWSDPNAFQSNYWPMFYSLFLAGIDFVTTINATTIQLAHSILFIGVAIATWLIVRRHDSAVRILTVSAIAVSPALIISTQNTGYEILLAFLLVWAVALTSIVTASDKRSQTQYLILSIVIGLSLGIAALTSTRSLIVAVVLLFFLAKSSVKSSLITAVSASLPLAVWGIRNYLVIGEFSFNTTNGPINIWIGSNPEATTGSYMAPPVTPHGYIEGTLRFMVADPSKFIDLLFRRMSYFWSPASPLFEAGGVLGFVVMWISLTAAIILFFGFIGWWYTRFLVPRSTLIDLNISAWSVVLFFLASIPFLMETRYRFAVEPLIVSVAIPTIIYFLRSLRKPSLIRFTSANNASRSDSESDFTRNS